MKLSRDPYNSVGKLVLAECAANRVTYKYACMYKIRREQSNGI